MISMCCLSGHLAQLCQIDSSGRYQEKLRLTVQVMNQVQGLQSWRSSSLVFSFILLIAGQAPAASAQDLSEYGYGNGLTGQSNTSTAGQNGTGNSDNYGSQNPAGYGGQLQVGQQDLRGGLLRGSDLQSGTDSLDSGGARRKALARDQYVQQMPRSLPPDPPTEFQKMVASSTGKFLPIYGAQLFRNAPSTFAPLDTVPVTSDYVVGPGDELLIQVWGQVTLNGHFTVDRTGNVYIPQVGTVQVAGLKFGELRDHLNYQIGRIFRNFDLNVNMGQLRSIQVFVVGQARSPGSYTVSSLSTLIDALFVTGGPTAQGSLRHILVKRNGKTITDFDLYDLLLHGNKANDTQLLPGDVIYIPPSGPQVAVAGSVNTPAIFELREQTGTVEQVLELAAGATTVASVNTVRLERVEAHQVRSITDLALNDEGKGFSLKDGDILELVSVVDRYKNGVTLRGNVANPGHYSWRPGMHVGDLFPDKDALITRDYWLKRGELGKPVLTYVPLCPSPSGAFSMQNPGALPTPNGDMYSGSADAGSSANAYTDPGQQGRSPDDALPENQQDYEGCIVLPSNLRQPADANTRYSQAGNGIQERQYSQGQYQSQMPGSLAVAGGSSAASAMIAREPGEFQPRNTVKLSEPDIDWSYAVIERQDKTTLTTSLLSFNLGKLVMDKDNTQNLALEPGDVVTIFSKADFRVPQAQQTRLVHLEGEFRSAGVYSVQPGETLRDLVKRAGGFTPDAYLYGSEFMRESTRRVQQQRLNEYVNQIALQAGTNSANSASRAVNALDTTAAAAMSSQSQSVIANLRQARSSGRIVLQLVPQSNSVEQLPDIPLEDGDKFVVPHLPSTVSVTGAVYNANAFIYDRQRRLKDYLQLAGGSNRDADRKSTYVIRADGSVVSRRQISNFRKDTFDTLRIYPGDTVVIPLNLSKGQSLRTVVDIAQIVGQFGLALAAGNTVF